MPHDAFISYSQNDKNAADAVVSHLERAGIRCWIAPRDVVPGSNWPAAIVRAINQCRVLVVVFSSSANNSDNVRREIELAVKRGVPVLPVRIEDVMPEGDLEFFLSSSHWMDAITPPIERHLVSLASKLNLLLSSETDTRKPPATRAPQTTLVVKAGSARRLWVLAGILCLVAGAYFIYEAARKNTSHETPPPVASTSNASMPVVQATQSVPAAPAISPAEALFNSEVATYEAVSKKGSSLSFFEENGPTRYRVWLREAENGNAMAEVFVGRCAYEGTGTPMDRAAAAQWFQKAADQGNAAGMLNLGFMYGRGEGGLALDDEMAGKLFLEAARNGNVMGMNNMGSMYRFGDGHLPVDSAQAIDWFQKAANQGSLLAMRNIADMYDQGASDLPVDHKKAREWYARAAAAGDQVAQSKLALGAILEAFSDYLKPDASVLDHAHAFEKAKAAFKATEGMTMEPLLMVMSNKQLSDYRDQLAARPDTDPMRKLSDQMMDRLIEQYHLSTRVMRNEELDSFAQTTSKTVVAWQKAGNFERVDKFWRDCYSDLKMADHTRGDQDDMLEELRACVLSLFAAGDRQEASKFLDDITAMCDTILNDRPWDWYLKQNCMGLYFDAAEILTQLGDQARAQQLLQRAWKTAFIMFGNEEMIGRYPTLPLKGSAPAGVSKEDEEFFLEFKSGYPHKRPMLEFTIPADFNGVMYPFAVYILSGKHGYIELQDQFRWVREYRGGVIPPVTQGLFLDLNKQAAEQHKDFLDICEAKKEEIGKELNKEFQKK